MKDFDFRRLLIRAQTLRETDVDCSAARSAWWRGYIRGLRRAHHGDNFGTEAEHALFMDAVNSRDESRVALGKGYRAGLTLTASEPETGL